jgi:hypothetical protein
MEHSPFTPLNRPHSSIQVHRIRQCTPQSTWVTWQLSAREDRARLAAAEARPRQGRTRALAGPPHAHLLRRHRSFR